MTYIEVTREDAKELAYMSSGEGFDNYRVAENRHVGERRWVSEHELVISVNGDLYRTFYDQGLTERQDISPFEDEGDLVKFERVTRKPVEYYEYEAVK